MSNTDAIHSIFLESKRNCTRYNENEWLQIWLHEGLIYALYKPDAIIDLKAAKEILKDRLEVCDGVSYPAITFGKYVKYWTKEAKNFQNTPENYHLFKAAAVIINDSAVQNIIINFYLKFYKPLIPAKFFHSEEDAYHWIRQFV